jgi:hypothetical protein
MTGKSSSMLRVDIFIVIHLHVIIHEEIYATVRCARVIAAQ